DEIEAFFSSRPATCTPAAGGRHASYRGRKLPPELPGGDACRRRDSAGRALIVVPAVARPTRTARLAVNPGQLRCMTRTMRSSAGCDAAEARHGCRASARTAHVVFIADPRHRSPTAGTPIAVSLPGPWKSQARPTATGTWTRHWR